MNQELIRMDGISKIKDDYVILDNAWLNVRVGETVGLLGMNNAGKTSLMRILTGAAGLTQGCIYYDDKPVSIRSGAQSRRLGIHYIAHHSSLVECFSVAENFLIVPARKDFFIDRKAVLYEAAQLLRKFELDIPLHSRVRDLDDYERLSIEILRATMQNARAIIVDNALNQLYLNDRAMHRLLSLIGKLNRHGISLILVGHHTFPLVEICDRIFILRKGMTVGEFERREYDEKILTSVMVGDKLESKSPLPHVQKSREPFFRMSGVAVKSGLQNLHITLGKGEIAGVCTTSAEIKQEFVNLFSGTWRISAGRIDLDGISYGRQQKINPGKAGIGILSCRDKVFPTMSLYDNVMVTAHKRLSSRLGKIRKGSANYIFNELYVKYFYQKIPLGKHSLCDHTSTITGAIINIARIMAFQQTKLLVCLDPTRNLDLVSSQILTGHIRKMAAAGASVLVISSDIYELIDICDRIYFFNDGALVGGASPLDSGAQPIVDMFKSFCSSSRLAAYRSG
ncbi:MAG TPA: hypothetical protein DF613_14195 [Lachnospiraceae bacterium]|nr:hypothetical protein [Lachnospiraceae bacterium]